MIVSSQFIVSPKAATQLPTEEETRIRFATADAADQDGLFRDLQEEAAMLGEQEGLTEGVLSDLTAKAVNSQTV